MAVTHGHRRTGNLDFDRAAGTASWMCHRYLSFALHLRVGLDQADLRQGNSIETRFL